jgi:hypothetical protein
VPNSALVPTVTADTMVKKMSGGTQAHLIRANDLTYYVVKFVNNPQHRRILVNELLSSLLLNHLCLPTPPVALVRLDATFIRQNSDVHIQTKHLRIQPPVGQHFGTAYPGSPLTDVVYEYLPDVMLSRVTNIDAFIGILAFDKWIGNTDSRQCIFSRSKTDPASFEVQFIDNGHALDGYAWGFVDSPLKGPYFRSAVYRNLRHWPDLESSIEQIKHFPETVIASTVDQLPMEWFDKDISQLQQLLEQLVRRRARIAELLAETIWNCPASFSRWQNRSFM